MDDFEYVWIDGGQVKQEADLWNKICNELNFPAEIKRKETSTVQGTVSGSVGADAGVPANQAKFSLTLGGSKLRTGDEDKTFRIDSMHAATEHLINEQICLVIDDFHYIPEEVRASIIRSLKGAVFRGLKVILLSTPHRAFEAIKAEAEITGRFKHVTVPVWSEGDLRARLKIHGLHKIL